MITENQALEIAKEVGYPTFDGASPAKEFTRALNLAAAVALEGVVHSMDINQMWLGFTELIDKADEYRQAAKGEMK